MVPVVKAMFQSCRPESVINLTFGKNVDKYLSQNMELFLIRNSWTHQHRSAGIFPFCPFGVLRSIFPQITNCFSEKNVLFSNLHLPEHSLFFFYVYFRPIKRVYLHRRGFSSTIFLLSKLTFVITLDCAECKNTGIREKELSCCYN